MKFGILGGGQLSQMLALSGIKLGMNFHFYCEKEVTNALNQLGEIHYGEYRDFEKLKLLANKVDIITYENENIPVDAIEFLENIKTVHPNKNVLKVSQDRFFEKCMFENLNIPTNQYFKIDNKEDLLAAANQFGYPFILKKRTHGYDGKGQIKINKLNEIELLSDEDCINTIAEEYVNFDREISLIGVRNVGGDVVFYDVCENHHNKGILIKTTNKSQDYFFELASFYLKTIMLEMEYVGVITVEFFQKENKLIANEMAPRVHNSGHWTIEGSITSQFENHLRSIMNLPLGDTTSIAHCCMYNILSKMPNLNLLLNINGLSLHNYQKAPKENRKLGHINFIKNELKTQSRLTDIEKILSHS